MTHQIHMAKPLGPNLKCDLYRASRQKRLPCNVSFTPPQPFIRYRCHRAMLQAPRGLIASDAVDSLLPLAAGGVRLRQRSLWRLWLHPQCPPDWMRRLRRVCTHGQHHALVLERHDSRAVNFCNLERASWASKIPCTNTAAAVVDLSAGVGKGAVKERMGCEVYLPLHPCILPTSYMSVHCKHTWCWAAASA